MPGKNSKYSRSAGSERHHQIESLYTKLALYMGLAVHHVGAELMDYGCSQQETLKRICFRQLIPAGYARMFSKVYYHYCNYPVDNSVKFHMTYLCGIDILVLEAFLPFLLQHYTRPDSGIGSRVRLKPNLIEIQLRQENGRFKWRELSTLAEKDFWKVLKLIKPKSDTLARLGKTSWNFEPIEEPLIPIEWEIVQQSIIALPCWPGGSAFGTPIQDLDDFFEI